MINKKISERAHNKLISKDLENKFKTFKENVVTDFATKIVFPLAVKNLKLLDFVVRKVRVFTTSLIKYSFYSKDKFDLENINYKDIEWAFLNPRTSTEETVSSRAESYNKVHTDKQCIALLKKREALMLELNNPKVSKLTIACLDKAIKDIEDVVRYSVANHIDEDSPLTMKKELEDFVQSLDNKNEILNSFDRNPVMDDARGIIQEGELNQSSLKDALKTLESFTPGSEIKGDLKSALKHILSYRSVDDAGSAERMLAEIKGLRGIMAEQKRNHINNSFNKDMSDELSHDIDHLQNMVNEGGIQPECDEMEEALVERVLPIIPTQEQIDAFKTVFAESLNDKEFNLFDHSKDKSLAFMFDSSVSEKQRADLFNKLSKEVHDQSEEEGPVRLYSSSVKDHFANLEDIDHWEKKDKE